MSHHPPPLCENTLASSSSAAAASAAPAAAVATRTNNANNKLEIDHATTGTTQSQRHFARLCSILADPTTDIDTVKLTLRRGVPDELRMDFWQLVLGVAPLGAASKRQSALTSLQEQYQQLLKLTCADVKDGGAAEPGVDPFPIDADVPRTMPTLHFFASPAHAGGKGGSAKGGGAKQPSPAFPVGDDAGDDDGTSSNSNNSTTAVGVPDSSKSSSELKLQAGKGQERSGASQGILEPSSFTPTQLALRRVLYLYSRCHRGRQYAQGMNEMVGLLLWAGSNGAMHLVESIESDVFFCFQSLMQWCGDHFCTITDHSGESGLSNTLQSFSYLLRVCDPELADTLELKLTIVPEFYAFRWISILFVLEFPVADVLSLWDFLLSFTDRISVACMFVAVAMLVNVRERIIDNDMSSVIELLQGYPAIDVKDIIATAQALIDRHTVEKHLWQLQGSDGGQSLRGGSSSSAVTRSGGGGDGGSDEEEEGVAQIIEKKASALGKWFSEKVSAIGDSLRDNNNKGQQQLSSTNQQTSAPPPPPRAIQQQQQQSNSAARSSSGNNAGDAIELNELAT